MMGPKIIEDAQTFERAEVKAAQTGIQRTQRGWAAVRNGRLLDAFEGPGCKGAAIQRAGTNRVIA